MNIYTHWQQFSHYNLNFNSSRLKIGRTIIWTNILSISRLFGISFSIIRIEILIYSLNKLLDRFPIKIKLFAILNIDILIKSLEHHLRKLKSIKSMVSCDSLLYKI